MESAIAQEVLKRNEEFLKITVSKFMSRCKQDNTNGVISREDIMQELTLCFLSEVEKHGEKVARMQKYTFLHAMYSTVIQAYPLTVPKRTSGFKKIIANITLDSWEDVQDRITVDDFTAETIESLSIRERLESMSENDRQIIRWRLEGLTQREIARRKDLTDVQMCREMKRIRRQFEQK